MATKEVVRRRSPQDETIRLEHVNSPGIIRQDLTLKMDNPVPDPSTALSNTALDSILDLINRSSASGPMTEQIATVLYGIDRFKHLTIPQNAEHSGLTFITRPRLCLTRNNLLRDPVMTPLLNKSPNSLGFMIRCLLDSKFATDNRALLQQQSMILDHRLGFITPLMNQMTSISGWPDPYLDTFTSSPGFHGEDQTFAIGSNRLQGTYDLSLSFQDIPMAPIAFLLFFWRLYIDHVYKGTMVAYSDDIDAQIINYTVSIYRFVLDPTRKYIVKYAKATGCFPKTVPFGDMMNVNEGEIFTTAGAKFTIPFTVNRVEYCDPRILMDFNRLVERWCPGIVEDDWEVLSSSPITNFRGIPYVQDTPDGMELQFKYKSL